MRIKYPPGRNKMCIKRESGWEKSDIIEAQTYFLFSSENRYWSFFATDSELTEC